MATFTGIDTHALDAIVEVVANAPHTYDQRPLTVRHYLACRESLPVVVQERIARDPSVSVRRVLASNPSLLPEVQVMLATKKDLRTRENLAKNPALCGEAMALLSQDAIVSIRVGVARHPHISVAVQQQLVHDGDSSVRMELSENPALTDSVQMELYNKASLKGEYSYLLSNPSLSIQIQDEVAELGVVIDNCGYELASNPALASLRLIHKLTESYDYAMTEAALKAIPEAIEEYRVTHDLDGVPDEWILKALIG